MAEQPAVLVTGGGGYIGSHACKALAAAGYLPVSFDNFSTGWKQAVRFGPSVQGDLLDPATLTAAFATHRPVGVMHFAAKSLVGDSMKAPGEYWRTNLLGTLNLIEAAIAAGCLNFVQSSTCAVYAETSETLSEASPLGPASPYGASKRAVEDLLADFVKSHGLRTVTFRYFNVAGAAQDGTIGEFHRPETHLIPLMLDVVAGARPSLSVYGSDYPTPDGTCIRDYVHVEDLADAHVLGLKHLTDGGEGGVFNLGSGNGFSVREVIRAAGNVTNLEVKVTEAGRRPGDHPRLVSGSVRAGEVLGWSPRRSKIDVMIRDAWRWHQNGSYSE